MHSTREEAWREREVSSGNLMYFLHVIKLQLRKNFLHYRTKLEDSKTLTQSGLSNGDTVLLIALQPCEIYIQGADQRMHTVTVPTSEPEVS